MNTELNSSLISLLPGATNANNSVEVTMKSSNCPTWLTCVCVGNDKPVIKYSLPGSNKNVDIWKNGLWHFSLTSIHLADKEGEFLPWNSINFCKGQHFRIGLGIK